MKRPWNIINTPVYSLQTCDNSENVNMNICTYVTAVSMKPKIYAIAIDYKTKTFENLKHTNLAVLQILSLENIKIIKKLGKTSGFKLDKNKFLQKNNLLQNWKDEKVLTNACAFLKLDKRLCIEDHGDHAIFLFDVISSKTVSENNILTFQDLVENKIIL